MRPLTAKQQLFVKEYLVDLNATAAAARAGYSARTAHVIGAENLTKPEIATAVTEAMKARVERVELHADDVLREVRAIALADTDGIVSFRRECCRYCWGKGFSYQFKTVREREAARREHLVDLARAKRAKVPKAAHPVFDDTGGIGFDIHRRPNAKCPECVGEGFGRQFIADTRDLSPALKSLYGGVKQTKEGLEVVIHPKIRAVELWMRHQGLLKDKLEVTVTDKAGRLERARKRLGSGAGS